MLEALPKCSPALNPSPETPTVQAQAQAPATAPGEASVDPSGEAAAQPAEVDSSDVSSLPLAD